MHPNFQVCLLGKHVGKEVLITPEMSLLAITEPLRCFWIFRRAALPWNHFSRNYLLCYFGSRGLLHVWALWSAKMKQESKSLKCLWCKLCSTFTNFGAYLHQWKRILPGLQFSWQAVKELQSCWVLLPPVPSLDSSDAWTRELLSAQDSLTGFVWQLNQLGLCMCF